MHLAPAAQSWISRNVHNLALQKVNRVIVHLKDKVLFRHPDGMFFDEAREGRPSSE